MREVKKIISTILAAPSGITGARSSISSRITSPIWTTNNYKKASVSVRLGRRSTYKYQLLCLHRQSAPPKPEGHKQPAGAGKAEAGLHTSFVGLQETHSCEQKPRGIKKTDQLEVWQAHVIPPNPAGHLHAPVELVASQEPPFELCIDRNNQSKLSGVFGESPLTNCCSGMSNTFHQNQKRT